MTQPISPKQSVRDTEIGWLSLLTVIAIVLRAAHFKEISPSHFDEGVYLIWGLLGDYPAKEFFAPPLFPMLIRAASWVFGPSAACAQMLSVLFGAATVPAVWWISRRWHGSVAGIASAAMAAFSPLHIAFSRLVLTDVLFTFLFVVSLALIGEALFGDCGAMDSAANNRSAASNPASLWRWLRVVFAGIAAGAALNTKYNGSLVLIIAAVATAFHGLVVRRQSAAITWSTLPRLGIVAVIAAMLYLPWFSHVHSMYGYGALMAHHGGYSTGVGQWPQNVVTMLASQRFLERGSGSIGPVVGLVLSFACAGMSLNRSTAALLACVSIAGFYLGDGVGWILGFLGMCFALRHEGGRSVILVVWLGSLILLTPLYRPYARLMLPLSAGGWVAYGALVSLVLRHCAGSQASGGGEHPERRGWLKLESAGIRAGWPAAWLACAAGAAVTYWIHTRPSGPLGHATADLRTACSQLVRSIPEPERVASYVRPPALFLLYELAGARSSGPRDPSVSDDVRRWIADRAAPRFLVVDRSLLRDNPTLREQLDQVQDGLIEVARFGFRPSDPVLLDDFGRACLSHDLQPLIDDTYQLVLYRKRFAD